MSSCADHLAVDNNVPMYLSIVFDMSFNMLTKLGVIMIFTPTFLVVGGFLGAVGMWLGSRYMRARLPVKRELSNAKAPVLAMVDSVITGLSEYYDYSGRYAELTHQIFQRRSAHTVHRISSGSKHLHVSTSRR